MSKLPRGRFSIYFPIEDIVEKLKADKKLPKDCEAFNASYDPIRHAIVLACYSESRLGCNVRPGEQMPLYRPTIILDLYGDKIRTEAHEGREAPSIDEFLKSIGA